MAGKPDPRPTRVRSRRVRDHARRQPRRCLVCGDGRSVELAHLLGGAFKEDDLDLLVYLCGDFGECRVHSRHTRGPGSRAAGVEIRAVLEPRHVRAIVERVGMAGLEARYPEQP